MQSHSTGKRSFLPPKQVASNYLVEMDLPLMKASVPYLYQLQV